MSTPANTQPEQTSTGAPKGMETFRVTVSFIVRAEHLGPWNAEACAIDFVRHRIDEGSPMSDHIREWYFEGVTKIS